MLDWIFAEIHFITNSKQQGNHWISFVIDITKAKIYYYDSLSCKIPLNLNKTMFPW